MMNYEMFKGVVVERIKDYLPLEYKDKELKVIEVEKVNRTVDGITFLKEITDASIGPTIYINDMYENYRYTDDLDSTLKNAARLFVRSVEIDNEVASMVDFNNCQDKIVFQLVNTEQNKEMLAGVPHREFNDLSVIYRVMIKISDEGTYSAQIHNDMADSLGLSEEDLFKLASVNTPKLFPVTIKTMNEVMMEIFAKDGMPEDMIRIVLEDTPEEKMMYVIGNERNIYGASSMLYTDSIQELAEKMGSDLYILPSSINEVLAVSADSYDPYELADMVVDVNMNQVELAERLSNQVYHYDKDLRKVSLATDTPNKRLDSVVAEKKLFYDGEKSR